MTLQILRDALPLSLRSFAICLLLFLGVQSQAANRYFDVSNASNLTPGAATWDVGVTPAWAASTTPGVTAPITWSNANDAFFQTAGANSVTISGTVVANSVTQTVNGTITTLTGGVLQIGSGTTGTIANTGNSALTIQSNVTLSGNITFSATAAIAVEGPIGGGFSLIKAGVSSLTLSGANTYGGGTTINAGTLILLGSNNSPATTTVGAGTLRLAGTTNAGLSSGVIFMGTGSTIQSDDATARVATNTLQVGNANVGDNGTFTIGAGGDLTFGALTLETQNHRTLTVNNGLTTITGGLAHSTRFLTKAGNGALVIRGVSDAAAGGMAINGGMLAIAGIAGGMNASEELKLNGGVFGTNGTFNRSLGTAANQFQWAARDETGNATASGGFAGYGLAAGWGAAGNNLVVNIGGNGTPSTMTWGSTASFVNGGVLMFGHAQSNGSVTLQNPLNLNAKQRTIDVVRSTVAGAGNDAIISAILSNGALVKTGDGILSLTALNTYTGKTRVSAGTLSLAQAYLANASDVWLTTGATLNLAHAGTDTINQLIIDNVIQPTGTWGSLASSATNKTALITGTGMLQVSAAGIVAEPPTVENQAATAIVRTTATISGIVQETGLEVPTVRIYYGTVDGGTNPANWQNVIDFGAQSGVVSSNLTGLTPFTQYYYRAFAQNSLGSDWADATATFTTLVAFQISEILPVNTTGLQDEDGTFQPWIEIWNPDRVNKYSLSGFKLVHGASQWTLPAIEILPDEYLIIFASGKNRSTITSRLHTNFTLSAAGGSLSLVRTSPPPDSNDSALASYPALAANQSFGRDGADITLTGRYNTPTPGEANNYSGSGVSGKVVFSHSSRAFTGTLNVDVTQANPAGGAVIRYTTNGAAPTSISPIFNSGTPIPVTSTSLLRARVFEPGKLPGETDTSGYLLLDGTTSSFNTAAPIVVVSNFGLGTIPDTGDQPAFMWVWDIPVGGGRPSLATLPTLASRCAVDRRGSSTLGNPKTNFNLEARKGRDDADRDIVLLGMPAGSDWVFHAPYAFDPSYLRNPFFYALSNSIGRQAMRTRMAEVFVETGGGALTFSGTNSGDYYGVYNVMEKIRRGSDRVDVAKMDTYDNGVVAKTGGFVFKVDRLDSGDSGFSAGGQSFAYYYPKENALKTPQRDPQEQYLSTTITSFKAALDSVSYTNPITGYAAWLDVPEAIDHHIMNVWTFNVDALRLSGYIHKERGGKLAFGPVWDVDRGISSTDSRDDNAAVWADAGGTDFFNYIWWGRMFTDADFYQRYIDRWVELRRGKFAPSVVNALIDTLNAEVTPEAVPRDFARWAQAKRTWTSPFTGTVYPNTTAPLGQAAEVQRLKDYLQQRANFFETQWVAPVTFNHASGNIAPGLSLTMSGPPGATIYYTLDGSDPRPSGGAVPGGANVFTYAGPIIINTTTRVRARAYHPTWTALTGTLNPPLVCKWSGPTEARFSTDTPASQATLAVTEVNYHPADPSAGELAMNPVVTDSGFEFIELKNIGAVPIDLAGLKLELAGEFTLTADNGITLAPGAFAILTANPDAFALRYPGKPNVLGPFKGDLSNGGEKIVIRNAANAIIADFTYDDAWYATTDGAGRTLAIYNPTAPQLAFSTQANWRASAAVGGSPGADEPNLAPVLSAGADVVAFLPSAALAGTANDDTLPSATLTTAWSKLTGPGMVDFAAPSAPATTATFEQPGIFTLRLSGGDGVLSVQDDVMVTMRDTPGAWLLRNPTVGTLNDDPDSDGRTNYFEWALGQNPLSGAGGDGTIVTLESGHLTLTYVRQKASPFATYTVQVTGSVNNWADPQQGDIVEVLVAEDGVTETIKATDTLPFAQGQRFIRLKISPP